MQVKILLFATLKDYAGTNTLMLELPLAVASVRDVREALGERLPNAVLALKSAVCAVNEEFAFDEMAVSAGDTVAFFPPVSGGSGYPEHVALADSPIDHDELIIAITTPDTGAVCLFSGFVRGATQKEGHLPQTQALEYEAYAPMALAKMRQVIAEIRQKWDKVQGVAVVQRVGRLTVGQNTVLIACASAHRDDGCFEAAQYGINRLKEIVPVWKKEIGADGEAWIEGEYHPKPSDRPNNNGNS